MSKTFAFPCRIELDNALMIIKAESEKEALRKAQRNEFEDIEWPDGKLVGCTVSTPHTVSVVKE